MSEFLFFFFASMLLAVMKLAGFIQWDWWVTAIPITIGSVMQILTWLMSR